MTSYRIGILTFHRAINYGAVLQCWALKRVCEKMGYIAETIDYNPFGHYSYKGLLKHRPDKAISYVRNFIFMNKFVSNYLNTTIHTESHNYITENPPLDNIYIVGSDTVWNKDIVGNLLNSYMLDFAPNDVMRISYAASMGGVEFDKNSYKIASNELCKFAAISVREPFFVDELKQISGLENVTDVCDPSLLLTADDYISLEKKKCCPKHYIAVFNLSGDEFATEIALMVKQKLNLKIVNLNGSYSKYADVNYLGLRPQEWLYLIHNADFVVTNSFHGTAFSIIYERPFLCCEAKKGGRAKTNFRSINLLTQTGLADRYLQNNDIEQKLSLTYSNDIMVKINDYRNRSYDWLKKSLEIYDTFKK